MCEEERFEKSFFKKKLLDALNIFRNWTEEFWTLTRNFQQFRQNCNLAVQRNNLIKSLFSKELLFQIYFRILSKNFSAICRKTSGRVVKPALYLSTGTFWENIFFGKKMFNFWDFQTLCLKVLAFIRKRFWHSRQNCNLPVQKNNLQKLFFEIFRLVESLLIFDKSFAAILQVSGRFVQTVFYLSKGNFLEDFFSKYFCQGIFQFWAKTFQTFGKKNCGRVFETVYYLSGVME